MDNRPQDETAQTLLDDADFLRLMEAEYKNAPTPVDELDKKRTWSDIKKTISRKKSRIHPSLLLVAAALLGFLPFVKIIRNQDELGMKGTELEASVQLDIQLLNADGRPKAIEQLVVGQTLIFRVNSPTASYMAVALQIDAGQPKVQFQPESPITGLDQILGAKEQVFVYQLDQPGQTLRFCLLAATRRDQLQQQIKHLAQHWPRQGGKHCQTLVVP
jgi:hypothetical protein